MMQELLRESTVLSWPAMPPYCFAKLRRGPSAGWYRQQNVPADDSKLSEQRQNDARSASVTYPYGNNKPTHKIEEETVLIGSICECATAVVSC